MPWTHRSQAPSPRHPAVAYCQGTPLRNEIEARDASRLDEATEHRRPTRWPRRFGNGAGRTAASAPIVITAVR